MLTNIYPVIKVTHLLYLNVNVDVWDMPIIFRGLFVVFFLLIIFFTGDEGKKVVKKVND